MDEEKLDLMREYDTDEDTAETAQEFMDEEIDASEAIEIARNV